MRRDLVGLDLDKSLDAEAAGDVDASASGAEAQVLVVADREDFKVEGQMGVARSLTNLRLCGDRQDAGRGEERKTRSEYEATPPHFKPVVGTRVHVMTLDE